MAFEEVVPGVFVNKKSKIKVSVPHPDPVVIIRSSDNTATRCSCNGEIYIFSSEEKAQGYINVAKLKGAITVQMTWDEMIDCFPERANAIIDPTLEEGFVSVVPLLKGI